MKIHIFWCKNKINGCDQNIGSPEKFCLYYMEHFGSLFLKKQANKKLFLAMQGVQKIEIHIFWWKKMRCIDLMRILGLLKSFAFLMWSIFGTFFFFKNGYSKPIKGYFSHKGCPHNENPHILVNKRRYMDMIKMLGLLKSFAFLMLSILGAFFQKCINQANKRLF